jgi:hypothetical protein
MEFVATYYVYLHHQNFCCLFVSNRNITFPISLKGSLTYTTKTFFVKEVLTP